MILTMVATTASSFSPFIPSEASLEKFDLPDKSVQLLQEASRLAGHLPETTVHVIRNHMSVINSYYSNLIEGNRTEPHEIRAAQQGVFSSDPAKRDLQQESIAHIEVQQWLIEQSPSIDELLSPRFICSIHREFYLRVPERLRELKDDQGQIVDHVIPGAFRSRSVKVGQHIPPDHQYVPQLMQQFCDIYHPRKFQGDKKVTAVLSAHHRLAWIHPFVDGNGRVARLLTDALLDQIGLKGYGVWCLSRGLARASSQYKQALDRADLIRQESLDGRGLLSEKSLGEFCRFMVDTAIDQVQYMNQLLSLDGMHQRITSYVSARNDGRVPGIQGSLKSVASMILYNAFTLGRLERSTALELTGMSERSARRLISQLRDEELLTQTSSKSPLEWAVPEHAEPWYFPQLTPGL